MNVEEAAVERLIAQVQRRAALADELRVTMRGILAAIAVTGGIALLFCLALVGAIVFAAVMEAFAR